MSRIIVIIISCLLLFSCASKQVKKSDNPGDLYVEGVNMMKAKKYDKAIEKFSEVKENFPFDPMALIATVKLADVYFERKEYSLALNIYEDFFKAHPEDENIPYVLLRIGECYDKLALSMDRDQAYTLKAIERYTYLKNRYPTSTFTEIAEKHIKALNQKLADRELYVGEFYYRTYQYNAAIVRLEYLLKKYPEAAGLDKALYYIAMSYKALGEPTKSSEYLNRLQDEYPRSILHKSIKREKQTIQSQKVESPPEAVQDSKEKSVRIEQTTQSRPVESPPLKQRPIETSITEDRQLQQPQQVESPPGTHDSTEKSDKRERQTLPTQMKEPPLAKQDEARKRNIDLRPNIVLASTDGEPVGGSASGQPEKQTGKSKEKDKGGLGFMDKTKPIDIVSDTMEGFDKEKMVVFRGSVVAKQDDLIIFTDVIETYMNEETNEISKAYAKGSVKIVKQDRTATAKEAFFDNTKGEIILKGDVVVFQGQDKVTGNAVTYYINEDKVVVEGEPEKRARAILTPKPKNQ
jgi:outer membrane protein assembly factor BamD